MKKNYGVENTVLDQKNGERNNIGYDALLGSIRKRAKKSDYDISSIFILSLEIAIALFLFLFSISSVMAVQNLIALQGNVQNSGLPVQSGNITITVWTQASGGSVVYNSSHDYDNVISSGRFDIMLGDGSQTLNLEYGKIYYMGIAVNGNDLTFNGSTRRMFQSNSGSVNWTYINNTPSFLLASDQRYNDTTLINGVNTSGNIKNLGFNLTSELNNLYYSITNPSSFIASSISVLTNFYNKTDADARYLQLSDQRFNESSKIPVNTLNLTNGNQFINSSYGNSSYVQLSDIVNRVGNWTLDKSSYNTTTQIGGLYNHIPTDTLNLTNGAGYSTLTLLQVVNSIGNWTLDKSSYNTTTQLNTLYVSLSDIVNRVGNWSSDKSGYNTTLQLNTLYIGLSHYGDFYNVTNPQQFVNSSYGNATWITITSEQSDNSSLYLNKMNLTDQRYNDTTLANSKAAVANCPNGQVVQNTTTGGVQCVDVNSINPAGNSGAIQYNNNSLMDGSVNAVITSAGYLNIQNTSVTPDIPNSGATMFSENVGNYTYVGYIMPGGRPVFLQPSIRDDDTAWCVPPHSGVAATAMQCNGMTLAANVGTISNPAPTAVTFLSQLTLSRDTSSALANNGAEQKGAQLNWWRGNATGFGGFLFAWKGAWSTVPANGRGCVGMFGTVAALSVAADCNAALNSVYAGFSTGNTTLQICSNAGAGTATCPVNCGANFPAGTAGTTAVYLVNIYTQKNGGGYWVNVQRQDTSVPDCNAYISANIPLNTQFLTWHIFCNNGGTAAACVVDTTKVYIGKDN